MKKTLLIGILLALVAVYLGVDFFLGSIVKAGVNLYAPRMTQTKVELAGAHISPLTGSGTLSGLTVGNPPGWSSDKAFYLGSIHVKVRPFSVLGDHVVVDEVTIDQPEFVYETKIVSSNIGQLLGNIEKSSGSGDAQAKAKNGQPVKFEVKRFRLTNGKVTIGVGPTAITVPMPPVSLDDLGTSQGGITSDQLAAAVMRSVASSIVTSTAQALGKAGGTMGAAAGSAVGGAANAIKGLFGGQH